MKLVFDASVAVKLVAPEADQEAALALLRLPAERIAPELLLLEAGNTCWKKVVRGELTPAQATAGLEVIEDAIHRFVADVNLAAAALGMALELDHPVYDCVYLALAEKEQATFVTSDSRLLRKLQSTRLSSITRPLTASN